MRLLTLFGITTILVLWVWFLAFVMLAKGMAVIQTLVAHPYLSGAVSLGIIGFCELLRLRGRAHD